MKKILEGYIYMQFFIDNFIKNVKKNHFIALKTGFAVGAFQTLFLLSILAEFISATNMDLVNNFPWLSFSYMIGGNIFGIWIYYHKNTGKKYEAIFNQWPEAKRKKWDWIMRLIILCVIANLFFSLYWLSHKNPVNIH